MKRILLIIVLFISAFGLNAQSYGDETAINCGSYYLKFSITGNSTCRLFEYVGVPVNVTIPSTVTFSGKEFAVISIGDNAFSYCSSLTSIEIPNSVTYIGSSAFENCSSLTSIEIPNSVTYIGSSAFSNCSSLTSIEIPNSVTYIGSFAFFYCSSLTSIEIPSGVTSIGDCAFENCPSLTSIIVESGNTVYDSRNNCNAIIETATNTLITGCQNTVIPNTVSFIGDYAFNGCSSLTSIEIPNSVTSIGSSAFSNCSSLTSIEIPNSVTFIGSSAFSYCSSLTSIEIPNSVTSIGSSAFSYCSSLTSIEIPNPVTYIGDYAFEGCYSLTKIYCYAENVPETDDFGWTHENMVILVPEQSLDDYKAASPWNDYPIFPLGTEGPAAPQNLTAQVLGYNDEINLSWDAVEGAEYYNVYKFDELYEQTSNVNTTIYGLSSNTKYCFKVTAVNVIGESEQSEEACVETESMVLAVPQNLTAQVLGYNEINLSWDAVEGAEYYNVYKFDELYEQTSNVNTTIYGLSSNTEYCFKVTAVNVIGESEKSEEACVEIEPVVPAAPQNLVANALSTSSIILTWDNIENAQNYNVYRNEEFIASTSNPHHMDSGLEYNTYYCYTVTATYADSESEKSEEACIKTLVEGVEELSMSFNIYPNPVNDNLYIETQTQILTQTIEIYDAFGRQQLIANGQQPTAIDVTNLNSGVYFIKIKTNDGVITKRFVKN